MYLRAAARTLPGDPIHGAFHYTKQVLAGDVTVFEFETTVEGKFVNGVDIIRCMTGRIVQFRVMIRPMQAINAVYERMHAMLTASECNWAEALISEALFVALRRYCRFGKGS